MLQSGAETKNLIAALDTSAHIAPRLSEVGKVAFVQLQFQCFSIRISAVLVVFAVGLNA